jgi:co-chaperonin GroES (HSP10)
VRIKPIKDRILVELKPVAEKVGSIWIANPERPDAQDYEAIEVTVLDVGPWVETVKPGDRAIITSNKPRDIPLGNGDTAYTIREEDVLAIC